ncbi:GAF domain-containing protein [Archangium gephyra]|uniref:histidine kinase n=1 Tax=Archangium gephyra TaxID=48 RepID=A0AAC8Q302_9BACT|nr:GAF domain-containing sensor histidine kinase [Archangium gephyra]AKI99931.1 diguanylate cyclase/phosphodiesterase [Archangium gephyra]REG33359.1 GAF domain-containing protein [Archangium gephyra]
MKVAPPHPQEEARLAALDTLEILDTLPEAGFDELTRLASQLCGTPIALVSLVDHYRQWFKSRIGLDTPETPREMAFCAHAILGEQLFVVEDAHSDERFHDNPLVTGGPRMRFYAGIPIKGASGLNMGTLCVIDHQPRHLTPDQQHALGILGHQVEAQLQLRLRVRELERREEQLRSQRDTLANVQRQKDELLHKVMRDFRAPLSGILTNAAFTLYRPHLPEEVLRATRDIRDAADSLHRTVSNLLDASGDEESLPLNATPFDVHLLLSEVARDFQQRLVSAPRRFTQAVKLVEPLVTADRELLRRTLVNLLDNAFQFTALGSSRVTLEATNPEPGLLELRVRDEGPAISPAARAHLFDAHLPDAHTPGSGRAEGGNRLALAFCRRAIQAHGGWLWVEDNHPKGVAFCIRLPVRPHGPLFSGS